MKIPLFEPCITNEESKYINGVLSSGWLSEGEYTKEFEKLVAERSGRTFGISISSGTAALYILVKILGYNKWTVPDYCFIAPFNAVKSAGKVPQLKDVNRHTLSLSELDGPTILVHYNNHKVILKSYLKTIHDIAHCIGTDFSDTSGPMIVSFSAPKTVTTGQGGMILTNDRRMRDECKRIKDHGRLNSDVCGRGLNLKYNDILAGFGIAQMKKLDFLLQQKQRINETYNRYIHTYNPTVPWVIAYESKDAEGLSQFLKTRGVESGRLYKPVHRLIGLEYNMPNATWAYENLVYLPSAVTLQDDIIRRICDFISEYENN